MTGRIGGHRKHRLRPIEGKDLGGNGVTPAKAGVSQSLVVRY
jgi:hypothetical protein